MYSIIIKFYLLFNETIYAEMLIKLLLSNLPLVAVHGKTHLSSPCLGGGATGHVAASYTHPTGPPLGDSHWRCTRWNSGRSGPEPGKWVTPTPQQSSSGTKSGCPVISICGERELEELAFSFKTWPVICEPKQAQKPPTLFKNSRINESQN